MKTLFAILIIIAAFSARATTGRFYILPSGAWNFADSIAPDRIGRLRIYCPDGATFYTNKDTADAVFKDVEDAYYWQSPAPPPLQDTILEITPDGRPVF